MSVPPSPFHPTTHVASPSTPCSPFLQHHHCHQFTASRKRARQQHGGDAENQRPATNHAWDAEAAGAAAPWKRPRQAQLSPFQSPQGARDVGITMSSPYVGMSTSAANEDAVLWKRPQHAPFPTPEGRTAQLFPFQSPPGARGVGIAVSSSDVGMSASAENEGGSDSYTKWPPLPATTINAGSSCSALVPYVPRKHVCEINLPVNNPSCTAMVPYGYFHSKHPQNSLQVPTPMRGTNSLVLANNYTAPQSVSALGDHSNFETPANGFNNQKSRNMDLCPRLPLTFSQGSSCIREKRGRDGYQDGFPATKKQRNTDISIISWE